MTSLGPYKPMPGSYTYRAEVVDVLPGRFVIVLTVKGTCPNVDFGHHFAPYPRLPMGVVFEGIIGPQLFIPRAINYSQTFVLPSVLIPEFQFFTVVDASHPQGVRVPWVFKPGMVVPFAASSSRQPATTDLSQLIVLPPKPITVFVGEEFSIEATINVEGNRNRYEKEVLDLIEAGTNGSNQIFWRYKAITPGVTIVTVTEGFGWETLEWKVTVLPPLNDLALAASPSPQIFVDFLEGVGRAVQIVRKKWPTAELHYLTAKSKPSPSLEDTTSPFQLRWLTATFFTKEHTIYIKSLGNWGYWAPPQARPAHISGSNKITWPLEGGLDLVDAYDLVRAAQRLPDPIKEAWLQYPLLQPDNPELKEQPLYYFVTQSESQWAVGTKTKKPVLTYEPEFRINETANGTDPFVPQPNGGFSATGFIKAGDDSNGVDGSSSALQRLGSGPAAVDQAAPVLKAPVGVAA